MSEREFTSTLMGMGHKVDLDTIDATTHQSQLAAEVRRYEWFLERVREEVHHQELNRYLEPLRARVRRPGRLERAMVALSVHPDPLANLALRTFDPPESLRILHAVCVDRRS